MLFFFFFQAEDGIRDYKVTGVQTCALPIAHHSRYASSVSPALPTTTFAPERSNHRLIDLPKRKLAVAVTASTAYVPSGRPVAAGEQWEVAVVGAPALAGGVTPPFASLSGH